jgi:hypothetical protein
MPPELQAILDSLVCLLNRTNPFAAAGVAAVLAYLWRTGYLTSILAWLKRVKPEEKAPALPLAEALPDVEAGEEHVLCKRVCDRVRAIWDEKVREDGEDEDDVYRELMDRVRKPAG